MKIRMIVAGLTLALSGQFALSGQTSAPFYFKKWGMVKAFPQPQEAIPASEVEALKGSPDPSYVTATYQPDKRLFSVEEIEKGKKKVRFEYFYVEGVVDHIDLYLADGTKKPYYRRSVKAAPAKAGTVTK